eukprot:gene5329-biopygen5722
MREVDEWGTLSIHPVVSLICLCTRLLGQQGNTSIPQHSTLNEGRANRRTRPPPRARTPRPPLWRAGPGPRGTRREKRTRARTARDRTRTARCHSKKWTRTGRGRGRRFSQSQWADKPPHKRHRRVAGSTPCCVSSAAAPAPPSTSRRRCRCCCLRRCCCYRRRRRCCCDWRGPISFPISA